MLITYKKLVLSLLLAPIFSLPAKTLFDQIIDEMNEMQSRFEKRLNRLNEEIKKTTLGSFDMGFETTVITIEESKNSNTVDITIAPLAMQEKTFDATIDQNSNTLTITTSVGTITVQAERYLLSVECHHQIKQESDKKNGKPNITMSSFSQAARTVNGEMALEETHIAYDTETQKLTISIPLRKKMLTKIPVTVTENQKESHNKPAKK